MMSTKARFKTRTVLGVDPGTRVTGYAVLRQKGQNTQVLDYGTIETDNESMPERLGVMYRGLKKIVQKYSPDEFAIETAFYGKNAQSALKLGHARGVSLLTAVLANLPTAEYSPREVKKAVTGKGSASKQQVRFMVRQILGLTPIGRVRTGESADRRRTGEESSYDSSDALAVALCHLQRFSGIYSGASTSSKRRNANAWGLFVKQHPERILRPNKGRP
ncbi:MAG: crossover junction endodeoxyribonuclease RuvC [Bacteroidota bacterium]